MSNTGVVYWLLEVAEILPACCCALYMSGHVFSMESISAENQRVLSTPITRTNSILQEGLVLTACLIWGVSVSSFVYRRQDRDPRQAVIFVLIVIVTMVFGFGLGASARSILLAWLPWAINAAMVIAVVKAHSTTKPSIMRTDTEKTGLVA